MYEPPADLSNDALCACIRARYQLDVAALVFLPIGHDSSAWVYRVLTTDGIAYFLKVRAHTFDNPAALLVPRYLRDQGLTQVIAPLPTDGGALWTTAGPYALSLYPFIASTTGKEHGMSEPQWVEFGALLRQIHATSLTADLVRVLRRDPLTSAWAGRVRRLDAHIGDRTFDDQPTARALAAFWQARRPAIRTLLEQADALGQPLAAAAPQFVLCHADIHTANVLLDADQRVWITDWDDVILAPRERDLMFVVGGGIGAGMVGPGAETWFFKGYGPVGVDNVALAYYRYCWAVSDIAEFGEQVFVRPDLGAATRSAAGGNFVRLFAPGNIVDLAFGQTGLPIR